MVKQTIFQHIQFPEAVLDDVPDSKRADIKARIQKWFQQAPKRAGDQNEQTPAAAQV